MREFDLENFNGRNYGGFIVESKLNWKILRKGVSCIMILNLSIEELKTLRRLQHSKEFEPYWAQITCILMLAHGHDAKTVAYDLEISLSSVYNYVDSFESGGIPKLTDCHYNGYWGLLDSSQIAALCVELRRKVYTDAKSVTQWVKGTRIRQVSLPPYSPNLNLIERLWKML